MTTKNIYLGKKVKTLYGSGIVERIRTEEFIQKTESNSSNDVLLIRLAKNKEVVVSANGIY